MMAEGGGLGGTSKEGKKVNLKKWKKKRRADKSRRDT